MTIDAFFAYARKRHDIYLRRARGDPPPWTDDPILAQYRFTNVFRELDKVTIWFRQHVRDPMKNKPEVLLATALFRWFNTIRTGETLFCQPALGLGGEEPGETAWEAFLRMHLQGGTTDGIDCLRAALNTQEPPWVTAAYMILSETGLPKVDGVLSFFQRFATESDWLQTAKHMLFYRESGDTAITLEGTWFWLIKSHGLGPFMAYEIVTDLRHTALLDRAPDILTWANPGPGALRGAARVLGSSKETFRPGGRRRMSKASVEDALSLMRDLVEKSRDPRYWPADWPAWEMREAEHTLCEFDKWQRAKLNQGRPKQIFRHA